MALQKSTKTQRPLRSLKPEREDKMKPGNEMNREQGGKGRMQLAGAQTVQRKARPLWARLDPAGQGRTGQRRAPGLAPGTLAEPHGRPPIWLSEAGRGQSGLVCSLSLPCTLL